MVGFQKPNFSLQFKIADKKKNILILFVSLRYTTRNVTVNIMLNHRQNKHQNGHMSIKLRATINKVEITETMLRQQNRTCQTMSIKRVTASKRILKKKKISCIIS